MANKKNHKHEHQPDQQTTPQPTAPATPLELSEEELEQVAGGALQAYQPASSIIHGVEGVGNN